MRPNRALYIERLRGVQSQLGNDTMKEDEAWLMYNYTTGSLYWNTSCQHRFITRVDSGSFMSKINSCSLRRVTNAVLRWRQLVCYWNY